MYFCIVSLFSPSSYNLFPVWISVRAIFHLFIRLLVHVLLEQGSRNPDLGLSISFFHSVKPEEILKEDLLMEEFLTPKLTFDYSILVIGKGRPSPRIPGLSARKFKNSILAIFFRTWFSIENADPDIVSKLFLLQNFDLENNSKVEYFIN